MSLRFCSLLALSFLTAAPSFGQTKDGVYGTVGDWRVMVAAPNSTFTGCRAVLPSESGRLVISLGTDSATTLIAPQRQDLTGSRQGMITVDGSASAAEFTFSKKTARAILTAAQDAALETGQSVSVQIPGIKTRSWSIAGFAKVRKSLATCVANRGTP